MGETRFDGRVAVVTGAGRGLGREFALLLAARGCAVIVNDLGAELGGKGSDSRFAAAVASEITDAGGRAAANFGSVVSAQDAQAMIDQAISLFGRIDVIIHSAGNFLPARPFSDTSNASFNSLWNVHVLGAANVIRAAWPKMLAQRYGRIVTIGSHTGYYGLEGNFEYSAAKAALHGLTMTLAIEGAAHGIAANILAPSALTRPVLEMAGGEPFGGDAFAARHVAPAALWLAHEDCDANGKAFGAISGNMSRFVIAETQGFQSRSLTPEKIREHWSEIGEIGDTSDANLCHPTGAVERSMALIDGFAQAPD